MELALNAAAAVLTPAEVGSRKGVAVFSSANDSQYTVEKNDNGTGFVRRLKIFKAGTFADSLGMRRTWTSEHLAQMVSNFNILRDGGTFPDVPVRADHRTSVMSLAGYFDALSTDGAFLYGDVEFTEPEMFGRFERRTFRGRSLEVGFYEANDESLFWPVVLGAAFVDIPAVEGLYGKSHILMSNDKETAPVETHKFRVNGAEVTDPAAVQAHIASLESSLAAVPPPAKFRVNGAETDDIAAVQAHITTLETFAADQRTAGRKAFVNGLVKAGKLTAPQEEMFAELAVSMTDDQYAKFTASYDKAPVVPVLQKYGDVTNAGGETTDADAQLATDKEVVAMHRRSGLGADQIKATASYKRLVAAGIEK